MPWWKRLISDIIRIFKALLTKKKKTKLSNNNNQEEEMETAIALKIIELVVEVGVPAAKNLFETWNDDTPITAEEIEKAKLKTKEASTYFE